VVRSDGVILGEAIASQYHIHKEWGGVVPGMWPARSFSCLLPVSTCLFCPSGLARDAHASVIGLMVEEALTKAGMKTAAEVRGASSCRPALVVQFTPTRPAMAQVDAVGVTVGPGLEICLRVGCEHAKALAAEHDKPFVTVHHLEVGAAAAFAAVASCLQGG
jgi:N6-L-threonylcarbamoyladenine synthase